MTAAAQLHAASARVARHLARNLVRSRLTEGLEPRMLLAGRVIATVADDVGPDSGKLDNGDARLEGWTVFVDYNENTTREAGEPFALTNKQGVATIADVIEGNHQIRETLPAGYAPARGFDVVDQEKVNDGKDASVLFLNVKVASSTGSVAGTVWNDVNHDGIHDATDPGVSGWTVFVDSNDDRFFETGEPFATTDAAGRYTITGLTPGRVRVRPIMPSGWDSTIAGDGGANVDIVAGATRTADFGVFDNNSVGSIQGNVWNDVNADGFRNAGDPGLGDWIVFLDANSDSTLNAGEISTPTDAAGNYAFLGIPAGVHRVVLQLKTDWTASPGHPLAVNALAGREDPGIADFAVFTPISSSISGRVYNDANGNGVVNADEVGLAGWTVFIDADNNGTLDAGENSVVTNADGTYTLTGVPIGSFNVREIPAVGFSPTAPGTGVQLVRVLNGSNISGINFGNKQRTDSAISGTIFADTNRDGIRNNGEAGLPGITVYLDLDDDGVLDTNEPTARTSRNLFFTPNINEAGNFSFTHLAAGTYRVRQVVPDLLSATLASERAKLVNLATGEQRSGVDFADRYRANEIHGMVFDDANQNAQRDAGESGVANVVVYIDLDRDSRYDVGEPRDRTDAAGVYDFTENLGPGAYVVRALNHSGRVMSFPGTVGGVLMPRGTSNPSIGNVTPGAINTVLRKDDTEQHTVSLTLPTTGSITNKVDVFLLFDDTGSFTANSPIVRAAFPQIIASLQAAMPGVDFGFGVGRFEEYANFGAESPDGRPFILNQPIVSASTPGFELAIQSALDRTAPGYGGDQPETDIEALFQAATGRGFDGNNNGTTTDSGAAGQVATQLTPGSSGDVPSFDSFTVDAAGNVLPASGSIGGAGFRPGALPIILTATDTGFVFQPRGETSVTGINGVTLPLSTFTQTSRQTTPFDGGAGLQETVTALNALGALVIGLGTVGSPTLDPRQALEGLATLTGAVNHSTAQIPNGTLDPIDPGDPLYFQISSGFEASVSNGIITAITNAVANVDVNLTLKATDPRVKIDFVPEDVKNVGAGETATFTLTFEGDGRPHRFDLQFVREGTDVVLGSIPVVIGTPISGDGYQFVELEDGDIVNDIDFGDWYNPALPLNNAPSFSKGSDLTVAQDAAAQVLPGFVTNINAGAINELTQLVEFITTTNNDALFAALPTLDEAGTLAFTPAPGAHGIATITVFAHDSGGTLGGGVDTSSAQTFTITIGSPATPLTIASTFEFETRQAITLDFSADVAADLSPEDIQLVSLASGAAVPFTFAYDAATRRATLTFGSILADGKYRLTIAASALPGLATPHTLDFSVLAGDANRDGVVNFTDLVTLAQNYSKTGKTFSQGNFDYSPDTKVDFNDLVILAQHYGLSAASLAGLLGVPSTPVTLPRGGGDKGGKKLGSAAAGVLG